MTSRKRIGLLTLILAFVAVTVATAAIWILYDAAFEQARAHLIASVRSEAALITSIVEHEQRHTYDGRNGPGHPDAGTAALDQIRLWHSRFTGFGETGEYTLARREGDDIVFVLSHRHQDVDYRDPLPLDSGLAEPMNKALAGESGTMVGRDYRGQRVLAAYEPVPALGLGLVAKMDLAEIRRPFFRAGLLVGAISAALVTLGSLVLFRVSNPLIEQLESQARDSRAEVKERILTEESLQESETRYRLLFDQARDHILLLELHPDEPPTIRDANQAALTALGYTKDEVVGKPVSFVDVAETPELFRERQRLVRAAGNAAFEVQHRRKDGSVFVSEVSVREIEVGDQRLAISIERDLTERNRAEEALRRSQQELQKLAARLLTTREEERTNLSRELHDNLGQLLTAVKLGLAWLERHVPEDKSDLKQEAIVARVREVGALIDEASAVTRKVSKELRPTGIDKMGLWPALEAAAVRFTARTGIECTVRSCSGIQCPRTGDTAVALFRIVQEALTNVARHAGATAVEITCTQVEGLYTLRIADNGRGIDQAQETSSDSLGLIGMRERARSIGGQFSLSVAPGQGTVIQVSTPLDLPGDVS